MAGRAEGVPRDVEPGGGGEQLVGMGVGAQEGHQSLKLRGVAGTNVGGLAQEVLRVADAADEGVYSAVSQSAVDDDGPHQLAGGLEDHDATVGDGRHLLHGGAVVGILGEVAELAQREVLGELDVVDVFLHTLDFNG